MATRSPFCARRCATWPAMGARRTVSSTAFCSTSAPAWAAEKLACAAARLDADASSPVLEMKPWSASARLLSKLRWAMSTWALAAWACCCDWRRRAAYSVLSTRAMICPACTKSPSRTCRPCSSPATRALTKAAFTALVWPEMGRPCDSTRVCTVTTSVAASCTEARSFCAACCASISSFCCLRVCQV